MSLVVYELNEVPKRLFEFYANVFPSSAFAKLRDSSRLFETVTADVGSLSPWITWPTLHRGVSNVRHEISDLGQDLTKVNAEYPALYSLLAQQGVKVGVFGSLQSYPLPDDLNNYSFYVPDTFAAGDECFPATLSDFQRFNLSMVKGNGRNVSKGIAVKDAARFLAKARKLGLTLKTFGSLFSQVLVEQANSDRVVRRRTSQAEISFDLFFRQLLRTTPQVSFFFTNHVASSMHRYWPAIFPRDYSEGKFEQEWLRRWSGEIPHAIKVANRQLEALLKYCNSSGAELIVCSSMGQGAVADVKPIKKQVLITNIKKFLSYLGLSENDWEPRLAMAPRVVIKPKNEKFFEQLKGLDNILVNGRKIKHKITSTSDVSFAIDLTNQQDFKIYNDGVLISNQDIGLENVDLQDASGSYAYHIPQGILMHFVPGVVKSDRQRQKWHEISVLDFAPSILRKFKKKVPAYMQQENLFVG